METICKYVVKEFIVTHFKRFSRKRRELLRTCNTQRIAVGQVTGVVAFYATQNELLSQGC